MVEKCQEKFIKWSLSLDWNTPGYIVREETKRLLLRIEAEKRAVGFEDMIRKKSNNNILKECLREVEKNKKSKNRWEKKREMYFRRNGMSGLEVVRCRENGLETASRLIEKDKEVQGKCNTRYRVLDTERIQRIIHDKYTRIFKKDKE